MDINNVQKECYSMFVNSFKERICICADMQCNTIGDQKRDLVSNNDREGWEWAEQG